MKHLITIYDQLQARLAEAPRRLSFKENMSFTEWHPKFKAKIRELLGPEPESVELKVEILEEKTDRRFSKIGD